MDCFPSQLVSYGRKATGNNIKCQPCVRGLQKEKLPHGKFCNLFSVYTFCFPHKATPTRARSTEKCFPSPPYFFAPYLVPPPPPSSLLSPLGDMRGRDNWPSGEGRRWKVAKSALTLIEGRLVGRRRGGKKVAET